MSAETELEEPKDVSPRARLMSAVWGVALVFAVMSTVYVEEGRVQQQQALLRAVKIIAVDVGCMGEDRVGTLYWKEDEPVPAPVRTATKRR